MYYSGFTEGDSMDISVGKFTLESLTTGMYNEPESCFREYIQNAVDSIDMAVDQNIISIDESRIEIIVDERHRTISIKDNGTGISSATARNTLLDIGNSTKLHTVNRGFRGIGRLGGLSYCKELSFCTTAFSEDVKTIVTFDCEKLKQLLVPGQGDEKTLQGVIEAVTTIEVNEEQKSAHYFIVKMEGVDDISSLLDINIVKDYISQVAPIPFRKQFYWGNEIKEELRQKGISIAEYPVFIGKSFEKLTQVFKPYKNSFYASSRAGVVKDEIFGISYFDVKDKNGMDLAYGWYADTDYSGTLVDESFSCIRVRLGNILIGSSKTLTPYFREARFNAWVLGELHIVDRDLIPNARRDDFERNETFSDFENGVRLTVGKDVPSKMRAASTARNNPVQKKIRNAEKVLTKAGSILATGFNSSHEKDQLVEDIQAIKKQVLTIPKSASAEVVQKKVTLLQDLEELEEEVANSSNYRAKNDITSEFSKREKKIIQAMLEVLTRNFERETVNSLYNEFLEELKTKGKR